MRQAVQLSLQISAATGRQIIGTGYQACAAGGFELFAHLAASKANLAASFAVK
jgi:hypothetical protein